MSMIITNPMKFSMIMTIQFLMLFKAYTVLIPNIKSDLQMSLEPIRIGREPISEKSEIPDNIDRGSYALIHPISG